MKKYSILVCVLFAAVYSVAQKSEVFTTDEAAINGYDPVAYFNESKPLKGKKEFTFDWNSARWYFVSKQNMIIFKASPESFAPQYGGYCAYGMARGYKASTSPEAWTIADGKLYLNYSTGVREQWDKHRDHFIIKADGNWPAVKSKK
jgi:hypothetical protein